MGVSKSKTYWLTVRKKISKLLGKVDGNKGKDAKRNDSELSRSFFGNVSAKFKNLKRHSSTSASRSGKRTVASMVSPGKAGPKSGPSIAASDTTGSVHHSRVGPEIARAFGLTGTGFSCRREELTALRNWGHCDCSED